MHYLFSAKSSQTSIITIINSKGFILANNLVKQQFAILRFLSLLVLQIALSYSFKKSDDYFYFNLYSMNFRILHWVDYFVSDIMTEIIRFPNSKNLLSPELQGSASQRSTGNIFKQLLAFVIIALSTTDSVSMVLLTNFSPCPKRRIWLNFSIGIMMI